MDKARKEWNDQNIKQITNTLVDAGYRSTALFVGSGNNTMEMWIGPGPVPVIALQRYDDDMGFELWKPLAQSNETVDELRTAIESKTGVNEVVRVEIVLYSDDYYRTRLTKRFAPEYGGGESTISIGGAYRNLHFALDAARSAITLTKSDKAAFEAQGV